MNREGNKVKKIKTGTKVVADVDRTIGRKSEPNSGQIHVDSIP